MQGLQGKKFFLFTKKTNGLFFIFFGLYFLLMETAIAYSPEKAGFSVKFKDTISPYTVVSIFVLPGEELVLEARAEGKSREYVFEAPAGIISQKEGNKWKFQSPPKKGLYKARIYDRQSGDSLTIHIFVMIPFSGFKGEYLNGYRIGAYPAIPWKKLPIYKPPHGVIEVTEENQETFLTPHFQLKQFLCKQESGYPKYVVLREPLLLKLELILERVNEKGFKAETFNILSGYRTPYYNKVIGNVKYSRHQYGGAADIFIDEDPKDDLMDDINKDGRIDYRDAAILYDIIDEMYGKPWYVTFVGGLGLYRKTPAHGPFVHVDVRGFHARWGT